MAKKKNKSQHVNVTPQQEEGTALKLFMEPRALIENDLTHLMYHEILNNIGMNAANLFMNEPIIASTVNSNAIVQRISINRYLLQMLLICSNRKDLYVSDAIVFLINDGDIEEWINVMREQVIPFIKHYDIFTVVYGPILMTNKQFEG